ncbi:MAG: ATP synthase F1 subunit gamma [Candidatus Wildermuthbacteria bacterium]|nr:ATP synthase F1 subunit gamma [Candidatus Wildermuthbacteria bacterium]
MELKEIRRKIISVNNIWKLTSALETLSALKMKKAQKIALLSEPFAKKVAHLLWRLEPFLKVEQSSRESEERPTILRQGKIKKILVAVLASDRGFCGSFNQNIFRLAEREIKEISEKEGEVEIFPLGKKAAAFFKKKGYIINTSFFGIGDYGALDEIKPISDFMVKSFKENKFQKIYLIWTDFISTFLQMPRRTQILPFRSDNFKEFLTAEERPQTQDFLIEPSLDLLSREVIPQLVEYLIYQCVLDSNAAEHSARMLAMRNASDNAQKKSGELKLEHNRARQEQITSEVLEISTTKEVLS